MAPPDDELERIFRLESVPEPPRQATTTAPALSMHEAAAPPMASAPAGATVAAALARSRKLHGGWRWSPEQKRLRALLRAQRQIGRELEELSRVGAHVMHARRSSASAQAIDHLVVNARGVFVIVDLVSSPEQPIAWHPAGHLTAGGISMRHYETSLVQMTRLGLGVAERRLGNGWLLPAEAVLCISGPWPHAVGVTSAGVTVCRATHIRHVVNGPVTAPVFNDEEVGRAATAIEEAFPQAT